MDAVVSKAGSLARATEAGLPVPPFVCVSVADVEKESAVRLRDFLQTYNDAALFAVRSSADVEDGQEKSYAGQFSTYLNVKKSEVEAYVARCQTKWHKSQVKAYGGGHDAIEVDVVVQEMVAADVSGVGFSANPEGMCNEYVMTIAAGAGNAVRDDVETTTLYYHADDDVYYQDNTIHTMSDIQRNAVLGLLRDAMSVFGRFIDIEFALVGGAVYLLQCRPITTLQSQEMEVFDNSNIVESYPGIVLPLTQSFAQQAYTSIVDRLLAVGVGRATARRFEQATSQLVRPLHGRMYYRLSSWYTLLELLPFSSRFQRVWRHMLGVSHMSVAKVRVSAWAKARIVARMVRATFFLRRDMRQLHQWFIAWEQEQRRAIAAARSVDELHRVYQEMARMMACRWYVTLENDMDAFIHTTWYQRVTGQLIGDAHGTASLDVVESLEALAHEVDKDEVRNVIKQSDAQIRQWMQHGVTDTARRIARYSAQYGDRSFAELKLESRTFRSTPHMLLEAILHTTPVGEREDSQGRRTHAAVPWYARYVAWRARRAIQDREQSRLDRAMYFGLVRQLMLSVGEIAENNQWIEDARDVFWLQLDEVWCMHERSVKDAIALRKKEYALLEKIPAYSRLVYPKDGIIEKNPRLFSATQYDTSSTVLVGTPCSRGTVEGEVVVVSDPQQAGDVAGKIIVATSTDPAWVFLLKRAAGIVVERGSLLSHTAIISRELGIPAVVGVKHATHQLSTGTRVRIDGARGEVCKV